MTRVKQHKQVTKAPMEPHLMVESKNSKLPAEPLVKTSTMVLEHLEMLLSIWLQVIAIQIELRERKFSIQTIAKWVHAAVITETNSIVRWLLHCIMVRINPALKMAHLEVIQKALTLEALTKKVMSKLISTENSSRNITRWEPTQCLSLPTWSRWLKIMMVTCIDLFNWTVWLQEWCQMKEHQLFKSWLISWRNSRVYSQSSSQMRSDRSLVHMSMTKDLQVQLVMIAQMATVSQLESKVWWNQAKQ